MFLRFARVGQGNTGRNQLLLKLALVNRLLTRSTLFSGLEAVQIHAEASEQTANKQDQVD